jgi:maleylacetoacetate isomerase
MKLYGYFRSSAAYRVRIALNLKGLEWEHEAVHLRRGEQQAPEHRARSAQGLVPVLETDGLLLTQSLAIIEFLEQTRPHPPLLPSDPAGRARVRSLALDIACEIHPLNNLRVLSWLKNELGHDQTEVDRWYHHWIETGFTALEARLGGDGTSGEFCHGDVPTLADVCLVPQVFNARRMGCDLMPFPTIRRIAARCEALEPFLAAAPENQPDAEQ